MRSLILLVSCFRFVSSLAPETSPPNANKPSYYLYSTRVSSSFNSWSAGDLKDLGGVELSPSMAHTAPTRTLEQRQQRGKKRRRESESCSPLTRKIHIMQQQLHELVQERAASERTQASRQQTSRDYIESGSATEPETSDCEDRRALQVGSRVECVLKKDAKRKVYSSKAHSTRTSRPNKQRKG